MAERVFLLPDPGEGLTEAEVVAWLVSEGDTVELNQPIAEVETAKAVVEIPSPYAGVVVRLHAEAGASVAVGEPLVTFDGGRRRRGLRRGGSPVSRRGLRRGGQASGRVTAGGRAPCCVLARRLRARHGPTPAVRRLARELGVEIGTVAGTRDGRAGHGG